MSSDWGTIESDPGVFTELIECFGTKGVEVEEVYDLEQGLHNLSPVHGVIFLFKWVPTNEQTAPTPTKIVREHSADLFFARQIATNACATQAIISILLNTPDLDLGPDLSTFKDFARDLPFDIRGLVLASSDFLRQAHNSFSRPEPWEMDESKPLAGEKSDAFHFISYVPIGGKVWELDGLKEGPIELGEISDQGNWLDELVPVIRERIGRYQTSEIRFNLMAVVESKSQLLEKERKELMDKREGMLEANESVEWIDQQLRSVENDLDHERAKRKRYRVENERRRFNYIPFVFELLKTLARKGKLSELVEKSK